MAGSPGDGRKTFLRFPLSQEEMLTNARSRLPTPIGVVIFIVLFFAIVAGTAYVQMGDELLGIAIYIVAAVTVSLLYFAGRVIAEE